jgi:ribosomal protein L10
MVQTLVAGTRLQVTNAVTRQKKEEIVSTLKEKLDGSVIVFGMRFKGLDVGVAKEQQSASCNQQAAHN